MTKQSRSQEKAVQGANGGPKRRPLHQNPNEERYRFSTEWETILNIKILSWTLYTADTRGRFIDDTFDSKVKLKNRSETQNDTQGEAERKDFLSDKRKRGIRRFDSYLFI